MCLKAPMRIGMTRFVFVSCLICKMKIVQKGISVWQTSTNYIPYVLTVIVQLSYITSFHMSMFSRELRQIGIFWRCRFFLAVVQISVEVRTKINFVSVTAENTHHNHKYTWRWVHGQNKPNTASVSSKIR